MVLSNFIDLSTAYCAYDILIFEKCSVVFVRCTDNNQQLDVFIVLSVVYTCHRLK